MKEFDCPNHGAQRVAIACTAVKATLVHGESPGFHWFEDDREIPCALCDDCRQATEDDTQRPHALEVMCGACFESIWNMNDQPPRIS
ncbi:hypothetical protein EYW49_12345 [Siculibacillus lacustris]|uniref:Uncharacterized protein n=1 Tax=Siculibacillus lacustris TaxID=1549641 RepID=A0A4Q9VMT5_9HYPH|nr:hypothetical protein [Siculibacillus lacustris]TBW36940.1 hypothetical protein EYW49_12345 [Siculibacillus lacustris]